MTERIISGDPQPDDASVDSGLRPRRLDDYVGQDIVKENLSIAMAAAQRRGEPLDHMLLYGPPGLGKTTLAHIIASEMGTSIRVTTGPAIERAGDMASLLTQLQRGDILFVDEVHRLPRPAEEMIYPALEDFTVSWVMGKGLNAQGINLRIEPFTLIGATTRYAMLSAPLRDRFGSVYRLDYYDTAALEQIVRRSARLMQVEIDEGGAGEIAQRARGTPRVANRLLRRVRDFAQVRADGRIDLEVTGQALALLGVDPLGLDEIDRRVLQTIVSKYDGGPVGLETISASIGEAADTIMDVYEPFLIQLGFLARTARGRVATKRAYEHIGAVYPERQALKQAALWDVADNGQ